MSFQGLLIHTIYKDTATSSQNDFGEWAMTYTPQTTTGITCRVSPWTITEDMSLMRGEKILVTGKYDGVRYKCYMDDEEDVSDGDRLTYDGVQYKALDVIVNSTSHHKSILLKEI